MDKFQVRTDLALEARESFEEDDVEIRGVSIEEKYDEDRDIRVTRVRIETENGAKAMGKPVGEYLTLEAPGLSEEDEDYHREVSEELAKYIQELIGEQEQSILVVGLGNREVTPDALGPQVVNNLMITRHIIREYGVRAFGREQMNRVSAIVPGVMAQTGMETSEIVKGIVAETRPDWVIAIDALAARSSKRLNRTIQLCGHQSRFRRGESQKWPHKGKPRGADSGYRCAYGGGRSYHHLRCYRRQKPHRPKSERNVCDSQKCGRDD